jgi:hypothetical protein
MGAEPGTASPDETIGAWAALGIAFDSPPRGHAPDLERLLLNTARRLPGLPRLLPTVVTWLRIYGDAVACHRLRRLVAEELEPGDRPALGLLLTLADHGVRPARFATVLRGLRPCAAPRPLFSVEAATPSLAARARRRASPESLRWGLWTEPLEPRPDVMLPSHVVLARNPRLRLALDLRGDLRASVLASLHHDPDARSSECALARAAGGSRAQVRNALSNLELTGRATRVRLPGVRKTRLTATRAGGVTVPRSR